MRLVCKIRVFEVKEALKKIKSVKAICGLMVGVAFGWLTSLFYMIQTKKMPDIGGIHSAHL